MRNPLTYLPRRWRMTTEEALTVETMAGIASRRLKVPLSMARFGRAADVYPVTIRDMDHANTLIGMFDALREERS